MSAPVAELEEEQALPAIYEHACNVYRLMESTARLITMEARGLQEEMLVWEGHLTKLITGEPLHLSVPYYTAVTRELKRMGCIRQLRRGGGNAPSQWQLLTEPTEQLFRNEYDYVASSKRKANNRIEALEQGLRALAKRFDKIEATHEAILDILVEREKTDG